MAGTPLRNGQPALQHRLRGYGQRDPLIEYKAEGFKIFDELMVNVKTEICHNIFRSASTMMAFENFLKNVPQQPCTRPPAPSVAEPASGSANQRPATSSAKRRGRSRKKPNGSAPAQSRPQRPLPLRQRQRIQALLRRVIKSCTSVLALAIGTSSRAWNRGVHPVRGFSAPAHDLNRHPLRLFEGLPLF